MKTHILQCSGLIVELGATTPSIAALQPEICLDAIFIYLLGNWTECVPGLPFYHTLFMLQIFWSFHNKLWFYFTICFSHQPLVISALALTLKSSTIEFNTSSICCVLYFSILHYLFTQHLLFLKILSYINMGQPNHCCNYFCEKVTLLPTLHT